MLGRPRKPREIKQCWRPDKGDCVDMETKEWTEQIPEDLSDLAVKEWQRVLPQLVESGIIKNIDYSMFWAYCHEWGKYIEFEKKLISEGRVFKAPKTGYPMVSPYVQLSDQAFKKAKEIASNFGLTPSARTISLKGKSDTKKIKTFELGSMKVTKTA